MLISTSCTALRQRKNRSYLIKQVGTLRGVTATVGPPGGIYKHENIPTNQIPLGLCVNKYKLHHPQTEEKQVLPDKASRYTKGCDCYCRSTWWNLQA